MQQVQTPYEVLEQPVGLRPSRMIRNAHRGTLELVITPLFSLHRSSLQPQAHPRRGQGSLAPNVTSLLGPPQGGPCAQTRETCPQTTKSPGVCPAPVKHEAPARAAGGGQERCPQRAGQPAHGAGHQGDQSRPGSSGPPSSRNHARASVCLTFIYIINCTARFPVTRDRGGSETLVPCAQELTTPSAGRRRLSVALGFYRGTRDNSSYWQLRQSRCRR